MFAKLKIASKKYKSFVIISKERFIFSISNYPSTNFSRELIPSKRATFCQQRDMAVEGSGISSVSLANET